MDYSLLCFVLHNVPETSQTEEEDDAAIAKLLGGTHEDACDMAHCNGHTVIT